jgi:hypothetical protein
MIIWAATALSLQVLAPKGSGLSIQSLPLSDLFEHLSPKMQT